MYNPYHESVMYPMASISSIPNTQAMLKSSSADSGVATLFHCKPSSLCSSRDMTSTPSPKHVLDNRHDPIFAPLKKKHQEYKLIHIVHNHEDAMHSQGETGISLWNKQKREIVDKPGHKSNNKSNTSRIKPYTAINFYNMILQFLKTKYTS